MAKVNHYLFKKYSGAFQRKYRYAIRQEVAGRRIRIKGRFVTRDQALIMLAEILPDEPAESLNALENHEIQDRITVHLQPRVQSIENVRVKDSTYGNAPFMRHHSDHMGEFFSGP